MRCPNCGSNVKVDHDEQRYIDCSYCESSIGNFSPFEKAKTLIANIDKKDGDFDRVTSHFENQEYELLDELVSEILKKQPNNWVAMTYRAISLFWLGYDNFTHLNDVFKILEKAEKLSDKNELVVKTRDLLSNDIFLVACKNEKYGDDLKNTLFAFEQALLLGQPVKKNMDKMLAYCQAVASSTLTQVDRLIKRDKRDFNPPYSAVNTIFKLAKLTKKTELYEKFYLYGNLHKEKNKNKSYLPELKKNIDNATEFLEKEKSNILGKSITFGLIGKIKIS